MTKGLFRLNDCLSPGDKRTTGLKRNPPWDFVAETFVLRAETRPEGRFFVKQHKKVKQQSDEAAAFNKPRTSEK